MYEKVHQRIANGCDSCYSEPILFIKMCKLLLLLKSVPASQRECKRVTIHQIIM